MNFRFYGLLPCIFLASCSSQLALQRENTMKNLEIAMQELQTEVADVGHALNSSHMEWQLLEGRLQAVDKMCPKPAVQAQLANQLTTTEQRLTQLEKAQETILGDLRRLSSHASQTVAALAQYERKILELQQLVDTQVHRLNEAVKLKSTLSSISKAMQQKVPSDESAKIYQVKSGDSLEKIARQYQITIEELKKLNHLDSDKIMIGQELKVGA